MKKKKQNEEALLNAFKIEELEERLEMAAPWNKNTVTTSTGGVYELDENGNPIFK